MTQFLILNVSNDFLRVGWSCDPYVAPLGLNKGRMNYNPRAYARGYRCGARYAS
jgi:hypothetical protein